MYTKTLSLSHYLVLLSFYKCNFQLFMKFSSDNIQCLNKFQNCKETLSKKNILQINLFVLYYIWLFMFIFLNLFTVFLVGVVISHVSHMTFLLIKAHYWFTCMLDMHSWMKQCACLHTSAMVFLIRVMFSPNKTNCEPTEQTLAKDLFFSLIVLFHYSLFHSAKKRLKKHVSGCMW